MDETENPYSMLRVHWLESAKSAVDYRSETEKNLLDDFLSLLRRFETEGWRNIDTSPKDGTKFLGIEPWSSGVFVIHCSGKSGLYFAEDAGDLWPCNPILWKPLPTINKLE